MNLYIGVTLAISWIVELFIILNGGVKIFGLTGLVVLMWIPGVTSLLFRLKDRDWRDIGFRVGKLRHIFVATFVPFAASLVMILLCDLLDVRMFTGFDSSYLQSALPKLMVFFGIGLIGAAGEEIGWRGYLTPKIYETGSRFATLKSGLVWALWHLPLVMFGGYYNIESPVLIFILYVSLILALNYFLNWIRMRSGSVLNAILGHAVFNFFFQTFWIATLFRKIGITAFYWEVIGGDSGVLPIILFSLIALIIFKKFGHINANTRSV